MNAILGEICDIARSKFKPGTYCIYGGHCTIEADFDLCRLVRLELTTSMRSEMVQKALVMGFTRRHIRKVLKKQINRYSCAFQSVNALIEALTMTPEDFMDFDSDDEEGKESEFVKQTGAQADWVCEQRN